jgi:hypothetical protein
MASECSIQQLSRILLHHATAVSSLQEADIQDLRKRLILQGKFNQEYLGTDAMQALSREDASNVSMEVLQASSRLSIPDAAKQRVWELYGPASDC